MLKAHFLIFVAGIFGLTQVTLSAINPGETCFFPRVAGNCSETNSNWYFDFQKLVCQTFIYSGCNGNINNFQSEIECLRSCRGFKLPLRLRLIPGIGVTVYTARREPSPSAAATKIGKSVNLLCKSSINSGDLQLDYCKWTSPPEFQVNDTSKSIVFSTSQFPGLRPLGYSFFGKSMADGQCGLTIEKVREEDLGYWSCLLVNKEMSSGSTVAFKGSIEVMIDEGAADTEDSHLRLAIALSIFVVALILLFSIAVLMWARKTDKLCFRRNITQNRARGEDPFNPGESVPTASQHEF